MHSACDHYIFSCELSGFTHAQFQCPIRVLITNLTTRAKSGTGGFPVVLGTFIVFTRKLTRGIITTLQYCGNV